MALRWVSNVNRPRESLHHQESTDAGWQGEWLDRAPVCHWKGNSNVSRMRNSEVDSLCMLAERRGRNIGSLSRHGLQFAAIAGGS